MNNYLICFLTFLLPFSLFSQRIYDLDYHQIGNSSYHIYDTGEVLGIGATYSIKIEGTISPWPLVSWTGHTCGNVEDAPQMPSDTGQMTGPVAFDFIYNFALPNIEYCNMYGNDLPREFYRLAVSLDNGENWFKPEVNEPYNTDHTYTFEVEGMGQTLQFKSLDMHSSDNYGKFRVTVEQMNQVDTEEISVIPFEPRIFPNPSQSYLIIDWDGDVKEVKANIINASGQMMKNGIDLEKGKPIQVTELAAGIYFIQFYSESSGIIKTSKFIKIQPSA